MNGDLFLIDYWPNQFARDAFQEHLIALYGVKLGPQTYDRVLELLARAPTMPPGVQGPREDREPLQHERPRLDKGARGLGNTITQRDAILITYGDQVREPGVPPLASLESFSRRHLRGIVSGLHILPFYPFSSDDGFSVIDYREVDPALGTWRDIERIGRNFRLMFDAVINHVSQESSWFEGFLQDDPRYREYFITVDGNPDLSGVVRPRTSPLLTEVETSSGSKLVWTTFSDDQIDLNYANPVVLLEILDILLSYVARGAEFIRLDAIAYLWKEIGTPCIHLPQTHRVVQIIRAVLDQVAPGVQLITETNVPHWENISYFGNGTDEAQLVYNFALPPLTLHAIQTGNALVLSEWAADLITPSPQTTFFNFLASHDGIGLNPARGLLSESQIASLVARAEAQGGRVSYKTNSDGSRTPYELNINYFDALADPSLDEPLSIQVRRFMAAQAILLSLAGMPGIYFHSLFGSRGWLEGVMLTGRARTINRQKLLLGELEAELSDPDSQRGEVFRRYGDLLRARAKTPAFHPGGEQRVLSCGDAIFAVLRRAPRGEETVLCLQNVSSEAQKTDVLRYMGHGSFRDLISGTLRVVGQRGGIQLAPYETLWLVGAIQ